MGIILIGSREIANGGYSVFRSESRLLSGEFTNYKQRYIFYIMIIEDEVVSSDLLQSARQAHNQEAVGSVGKRRRARMVQLYSIHPTSA